MMDYGFRMPGVVEGLPRRSAAAPTLGKENDRVARLAAAPEGPTEGDLWNSRVGEEGRADPIVGPAISGNQVYHLVQNRDVIDDIFEEQLPPDEYYDALLIVLAETFPKADPDLLIHLVPVVAAFDTATAFAMSFGIAKFQLAQRQVKLVGEIVGREGRSPNPAIVRAIKHWPPVNTLKDLQCFLGTANYVRAHAGPAYARVSSLLRDLLKPTDGSVPAERCPEEGHRGY